MSGEDLSQFSMLDLFRLELESQSQALTAGLLALERDPVVADTLEACMRAAHSLKGAARIIDLEPAVRVAHGMEECLVAAQRGQIRLNQEHIDCLLRGIDLLSAIASDQPDKSAAAEQEITLFLKALEQAAEPHLPDEKAGEPIDTGSVSAGIQAAGRATAPDWGGDEPAPRPGSTSDRMVRVTAEGMNRLLGLAGETMTEARRLRPLADGMLRLKRHQDDLAKGLDKLRALLPQGEADERVSMALAEIQERLTLSRELVLTRMAELDSVDRRATDVANRLYSETLSSRMRPFEDGVRHYSRIVRDLGRALGKKVRLEIVGGSTGIDRDILDQLDAPLGHLLRNAVDHGVEMPDERIAAGKSPEGVIRIEARHNAGLLQIIVADDGSGIDLDTLRYAVLSRRLATEEMVGRLSDSELLEFLFLPGFSMKQTVTDLSGRGVGLDVVHSMAKQVRGATTIASVPGAGTTFQLELPLTLSVIRTLLVEIGGEPYAFPLSGITRTLRLQRGDIEKTEGRPHFPFEDRQVGIISAQEVLELENAASDQTDLAIVVIGEGAETYGLAVERFLGERELVVRTLDRRLAKVRDISAAGLLDDGSPVLIVDMDDLIRSAGKLAAAGPLRGLLDAASGAKQTRRKRILVVDDSLTVRELERKLLDHHGYEIEVAVDGMDGWNAVRSNSFDLVVTDIDMPRLDGIELVSLIKRDPRLRNLPVMIVSYKDREEDRRRGLDAGADYYLAKGSFHDETLIHAVVDLIGAATG